MKSLLILSIMFAGCVAQVEEEPPVEEETPGPTMCEVPYERDNVTILCVFECADCNDHPTNTCEKALPTALDICLHQLRQQEDK